jgi:hypothetical protein
MLLLPQEVTPETEDVTPMQLEWYLTKIYLDNNSFQVSSFKLLKPET